MPPGAALSGFGKGFGESAWKFVSDASSSASSFISGSAKKVSSYVIPEQITEKAEKTIVSFQNLALVSTITVALVGSVIALSYSSKSKRRRL